MVVATTIVFVICTLATGTCRPEMAGQLTVISLNESIELFYLTDDSAFSIFSAQMDIYLRPPCPSCHPSYNYILHDDQFIVPSTGVVSFFTFLPEEPYVYTQVVPTPNCEPLSLFETPLLPNCLFLDCEDLETKGNYFLAQLERFAVGGGGDYVWVFSELNGFESLEQAGAYTQVAAFNSYMMLYVHEVQEHIELNGFLSGYINILVRPDNCLNIVRITATGNSEDILLECSSSESELVSDIYLLDSASSTHLLKTSPYQSCPIRFTEDGSVVAVFTELYIIVIDLISETSVNISINQAIYDGVISQSGGNFFNLVYSTPSGLYRVQLSTNRNEGTVQVLSESLFPDTSTICASKGCPLLYLVNQDLLIAALSSRITTFSITSLQRSAPDIETLLPPSRIVFQQANLSSAHPLRPTPSLFTASLQVTIAPSVEVESILRGRQEGTQSGVKDSVAAVVASVVSVTALTAFAVITVIAVMVASRKKRLRFSRTRLSRSSDMVELISCDSESVSSESRESSLIVSSAACFRSQSTIEENTGATEPDQTNKGESYEQDGEDSKQQLQQFGSKLDRRESLESKWLFVQGAFCTEQLNTIHSVT